MKAGLIALSVVVLGAIGFLVLGGDSDDSATTNTSSSTPASTSSSRESGSLVQNEITPGGEIVEYSEATLANSDAETDVLFFHAAWCSVCNSVERNLEAGVIPEGMRIHKIDHDSDVGQDLADKYNIPIQYTMVQVDNEGNELTKWVNQSFFTIDDILERIQTT